jgi:predicted HTH domain antitoxin
MDVTVTIPDKFVPPSVPDDELSRDLLEAYAIENYRSENLSLGQIAELLSLSIDETHAFFKAHNVNLLYGIEDLERDRRTIEIFLNK